MLNRNALILRGALIVIAALACSIGIAQADCCGSIDGGICSDGTCGTPCCGEGSCNIFCCNCDGGCRSGCVTCVLPSASAIDRFRSVDENKDNKISLIELQNWLKKAKKKIDSKGAESEFAKVDVNKDGFIQPGEFDKAIAKQ